MTTLLPTFKLGDAETTKQVRVRHLICACTGLPRQDLEWLFEYEGVTPASALATLGTMQPTSKFGELFQYSNPMAGAAGFTGGHVLYPKMELGAAYDKAMQVEVFDPARHEGDDLRLRARARGQPRRTRTRPTSTASPRAPGWRSTTPSSRCARRGRRGAT